MSRWWGRSKICDTSGSPNETRCLELVQVAPRSGDRFGRRVVVEQLPAGERGAGVPPDQSRVVELVQVAPLGHDGHGGRVVVEQLPAGERGAGVPPDQSRVVELVQV